MNPRFILMIFVLGLASYVVSKLYQKVDKAV